MSKKRELKKTAVLYSLLTIVIGAIIVGLLCLLAAWEHNYMVFAIGFIVLIPLCVYKTWYNILKEKEDERRC